MLDTLEVQLLRRELTRLSRERYKNSSMKKELTIQINLIRTVLLSEATG
ncbi:hypothetical protein [Alkalicoccobacillus murimartini]|nr:hypothetical protein [Alkalicoccobacillus murimartini]